MLDYNTLNNLVEIFKKQGVRGVTLENGSTLEIKDGALLINGKNVGGVKVIDTDNITALSTETIEGLSAGDIVVKHTGEQTHTYIVTYKEEHQGICISYFAAGYSETVSYDYVTDAWVYNSTDIVTPKEYTGGDGISINAEGLITNTAPHKKRYCYCYLAQGMVSGDHYIISVVSDKDINISSLAQSIPIGAFFKLFYNSTGIDSSHPIITHDITGRHVDNSKAFNIVGLKYTGNDVSITVLCDDGSGTSFTDLREYVLNYYMNRGSIMKYEI